MENDSAPRRGNAACFFDANLEDAKPPDFEFRDELVVPLLQKLESRQMLVLGGHGLEDKKLFAKHLAWSLSERLAQKPAESERDRGGQGQYSQPIQVKQWCPGFERQDFCETLRQFTGETILLFPDVYPHDQGRGLLRRLYAAVCRHDEEGSRHYAIVTTDSELADWGGEDLEKHLWYDELKMGDIYSSEFLTARLCFELRGCEALREAGHSIEDLARELRTPDRVRHFADLVKANHDPIKPGWIEKILHQLSGEEAAVREWFDELKPPRLRALALGLALLDGLLRDQALAVLDILVVEVFRRANPQFESFATSELSLLGAFFRGPSEGGQEPQITCLSSRHREAILIAAWHWDQSQVRAALPVLASIATWSGSFGGPAGLARAGGAPDGDEGGEAPFAAWLPPGYEPRLFGTPERVQQIQWTVSVTLSEIGKRISFEAVKNVLLSQLAANRESDLRRRAAAHCVAAAALALWCEPEAVKDSVIEKRKSILFEILERWCGEAAMLESEGVRATVVLCVGYAARFYPPNQLPSRLVILFEELCNDEASIVWELARLRMVPMVAELHVSQVEPFLRETLAQVGNNEDEVEGEAEKKESETRLGLAMALAAACSFQPTEGLHFVEDWYRTGLRAFRISPAAKNRLIAVVLAYGWIAADDLGGKDLPVAEISRRLRKVIRRDQAIRASVVETLEIQISRDPEKVVPAFGVLLMRLKRQELGSLVRCLTALHLRESEKQKGSWLATNPGHKTTLTSIETALEPWLRERQYTAAGRIAARSLLEISALPREVERRERLAEREWVAGLERKAATFRGRFKGFFTRGRDPVAAHRARWKRAEEREAAMRSRPLHDLFLTPVFLRLAVFWATILSPRDRKAIQAQFEELLDHWQSAVSILREPRKWLARIFDRYEDHAEDLQPIVDHLVRSVWLFRYRWPVVLTSGLLLASLAVNLYAQ